MSADNSIQSSIVKKKRKKTPALAGTMGRGGVTPLEVQQQISKQTGFGPGPVTAAEQATLETQRGMPPITPPGEQPPAVIAPGPKHGVQGYAEQPGTVAKLDPDIEAEIMRNIEGPIDATLANLTKAHYEVFGSWPSWSLTADILDSGEVEFPTYEEALSFFMTIKRSYATSGKEWQLDAQGTGGGLLGQREREKGLDGFGPDTDVLDPEMIASFAPKKVEDFLFGPYMKRPDKNRVSSMYRQSRLRLDEMLIQVPKQWAISNLSDRLSARSRRHNPDRDEDEQMMEELNVYLGSRVPAEMAPAPTAAWQNKTEEALRYIQMMRAGAIYVATGGEDDDAAGLLHTQGFSDIVNLLEEQIRLPADQTGRTDEARRAWVQEWYVQSRNPGVSEKMAIHELSRLNLDMVTIEGQRQIGYDHLAGYAGTIKGWFEGIPGAEQVADVVTSDEFQKVAGPAIALAGDIVEAIKPVVMVPVGAFIETYEFYDKYADAFQSAVRAADDSVLATVLKPLVLPLGFFGLVPGQPEYAKVISGTDADYSSLWSQFFTQVFKEEDGDIEWVGDFVEDFKDNLKRREEGLPADYGSEVLSELGVNPLTNPEAAFLATFVLDSVRDLGVAKVAGVAATAIKGTERFAKFSDLARTTLHKETASQTLLRFFKQHADRELKMSDAEAKALRAAGDKTVKTGMKKTASAGDEFTGQATNMFGVHPRDAVELRDILNEARAVGMSDDSLLDIIRNGIGQPGKAPGWMARTGKSNLSADSWGLSWRMREKALLDPTSVLYRGNHPVIARWFERLFDNPILAVTDEQLPSSTQQIGFGYRTAFKPEELKLIIDDDLIWAAGKNNWVLYDELQAIKESGDLVRYATLMQGVFADMERNAVRDLMVRYGVPLADIPKDLIATHTVELRNMFAHQWFRKVTKVMTLKSASKRFTNKLWKKNPEDALKWNKVARELNPDVDSRFIPEAAMFRRWEDAKIYNNIDMTRPGELAAVTAGGQPHPISLVKQGEPKATVKQQMPDGSVREVEIPNEQSIGPHWSQLEEELAKYRLLLDGDDQTMGLRQLVHDLGLGDPEQLSKEADAIDEAMRLSMQTKEARHPNKIIEKVRSMATDKERLAFVASLEARVKAKQERLATLKRHKGETEAHYNKRRARTAAEVDRAAEKENAARFATAQGHIDQLRDLKAGQATVEEQLAAAQASRQAAEAAVAAANDMDPADIQGWGDDFDEQAGWPVDEEGLPFRGDVSAGGPLVWGKHDAQATELQQRIRAANEAIAAGLEKGQVEPGVLEDAAENLAGLRDELMRAEGLADELRAATPSVQGQMLDLSNMTPEEIKVVGQKIKYAIEAADESVVSLRAAVAQQETLVANARVAQSQLVHVGAERPGVRIISWAGGERSYRTSKGTHWKVVDDDPARPGVALRLSDDDRQILELPEWVEAHYKTLLAADKQEQARDLIINYYSDRFFGHWENVPLDPDETIAGQVRTRAVNKEADKIETDELGLGETLREGEEAAYVPPHTAMTPEQASGLAESGGGVRVKGKLIESETVRVFVPPDEELRDLVRRIIAEGYRRDNIVFDLPATRIGFDKLKPNERGGMRVTSWGEPEPPKPELVPSAKVISTPDPDEFEMLDEFGRPLDRPQLVTAYAEYQRELVWDPRYKRWVPEGKLILNEKGEPIPAVTKRKPLPGGAARVDRFRRNNMWLLDPEYDDMAIKPKRTQASWKGKVYPGEEVNPTVAAVLSSMMDDFIEQGYYAPIMTDLPDHLLRRSQAIAAERELFRELRGLGGTLHQNVPMHYTVGNIAKATGLKPGEVFTDPKATGTLKLIQEGKRTSTTRSKPLGKIGDRVTFKGDASGAEYKITGTHVLTAEDLADPKILARLSETEGYTIEAIKKMKEFRPGQVVTRFEKIEGTGRKLAEPPRPEPVSMPMRPLEDVTAEMNLLSVNINHLKHRTDPWMDVVDENGLHHHVKVKPEEAEALIANLRMVHRGLQQEALQAHKAAGAQPGTVSAGGPAFWKGVDADAAAAATEAQPKIEALLLQRNAMIGELDEVGAVADEAALDALVTQYIKDAGGVKLRGNVFYDPKDKAPWRRHRGQKMDDGVPIDVLRERINEANLGMQFDSDQAFADWITGDHPKPMSKVEQRRIQKGIDELDAQIKDLNREGMELRAYLKASAPKQRAVSTEGMNAADVLANAAPVSPAGAAAAAAGDAAQEISDVMAATVQRLEREWLEADVEIKQLESQIAANLAALKGGVGKEMSEQTVERLRQFIDWLDPRATPEEYIAAARKEAFDEDSLNTMAHILWLLENHPEQALGWAVQPSREWQLRVWGSMGFNPTRVAKFRAGGLIRRAESVWANKDPLAHRWSIDDMTTLYKTVVMFKVSTMLRITMADEFTRLFAENINPLEALKGAKMLKALDKLPEDIQFKLSEMISKSVQGNMVLFDLSHPKAWLAYRHLLVNDRRDPTFVRFLYGKQIGEGQMRDEVDFFLANDTTDTALHEIVADYLAAADAGTDPRGLIRAWYAMGMLENEGLYRLAAATHRIVDTGTGTVPRRAWIQEDKWKKNYGPAENVYQDTRNLTDGLIDYWEWFYNHKFLGDDWKPSRGFTDAEIAVFKSGDWHMPTTALDEDGIFFGDRSELTFYNEPGKKRFHALQAYMKNPDTLASREEVLANLPGFWGHSDGTVTGGLPVVRSIRDKMYSILDFAGSKLNEMVFASAFQAEKKLLVKNGMEELAAERNAIFYAREYTHRVMFNNATYMGEDMLRNVVLFLPAYRQFVQYWVPYLATHPGVASLAYRANRDKDQFSEMRVGPMQFDFSRMNFLVNQGDNRFTGWLPSGGPLISMPLNLAVNTSEKDADSIWGSLAGSWPFEYTDEGMPLNSPLDKMWYGLTGKTMPWPLGSDGSRNLNRELAMVRAAELKGQRMSKDEAYWKNRMNRLKEGGWNFLVPVGMRFIDEDVDQMQKARLAYNNATTPQEVEELLADPANKTFKTFMEWQNKPSWDQLQFLKEHPEIVPYMVSGYEGQRTNSREIGFIWSKLRDIGAADPAGYVDRIDEKVATINRVIEALDARKARDEETKWWEAYRRKHIEDHDIARLTFEWQNSEGAFAPGGHFFAQGRIGYAARNEDLNGRFTGLTDPFTGITTGEDFDSDTYRFAKLLDEAGGAAKAMLQLSPNYDMYVYAKLQEHTEQTTSLLETWKERRMATRMTPQDVARAGYKPQQVTTIMTAVKSIDQLWDAADKACAKYGKYGYATTEGRAIRKQALEYQNALIDSSPLLKGFLGDNIADLYGKSYLTKPAYQREDLIRLDDMDEAERESFYRVKARKDENGRPMWNGLYEPEGEKKMLKDAEIIGYVPTDKGWMTKVRIGQVVGLMKGRAPGEGKQIELTFARAYEIAESMQEAQPDTIEAELKWLKTMKKSMPTWAERLIEDGVRAACWKSWLNAAKMERHNLRTTINEYYSDAPGFSLNSKYGMRVKKNLLRYAKALGEFEPTFGREFRNHNSNNEMLNSILGWYL